MLAVFMALLVAALMVIVSFLIGFFGRTYWAMARSADRESRIRDGYSTFVVRIPVRVRVLQCAMLALLMLAVGWALAPICEWLGEEGGAILVLAFISPIALQYCALNPLIKWANDLSVAGLADEEIPCLKKPIEPGKTCVVSPRW
jgi:hypothetical protein